MMKKNKNILIWKETTFLFRKNLKDQNLEITQETKK